MSNHSATELETNSGFLLQLEHRMALQIPELGIVTPVPGQESNWHLGEQKEEKIKVAHEPRTEIGIHRKIAGSFFFLQKFWHPCHSLILGNEHPVRHLSLTCSQ